MSPDRSKTSLCFGRAQRGRAVARVRQSRRRRTDMDPSVELSARTECDGSGRQFQCKMGELNRGSAYAEATARQVARIRLRRGYGATGDSPRRVRPNGGRG